MSRQIGQESFISKNLAMLSGLFVDVAENQSFIDQLTISYIYEDLPIEENKKGLMRKVCLVFRISKDLYLVIALKLIKLIMKSIRFS